MKGSRLYIDIFKVFCDVAETKSFSKAAEINYITQSAVSQQLAFIERLFNKKLINRGKGAFSLTQEGQIFLNGCKKILKIYQSTLDQIQHDIGELPQTINIETVYSLGFYHLPPLVKSFMNRYNNINLHIEYNRSDRIYADVIQGVCDFGIIAYPWQHPLINVQYGQEEVLVFVCSPKSKYTLRKTVSLKNLHEQDFIGFIKEIPTRNYIDDILKDHDVMVHIADEYDNVETLKRSVELGVGVSILPLNTIEKEIRKKTLVSLPIKEGPFYRTTGIITRKDRPQSKAGQEVIKWIVRKK
ncbi:MAG TPA: LysR family transcriptional regulator [Candidatus Marinimicrobia bacterium]|nr:LysR family transcriptional regulator [Candidatus Neomarinimicrobiota bacterium]MDP7216994.1 LysR family transcriptional regulator [Candidatus Neomarinimicrobiota bacterium]HJM69577.1 LysR family transcriptional regulator [Candidatus Neomarinimicrobiota bacterium]